MCHRIEELRILKGLAEVDPSTHLHFQYQDRVNIIQEEVQIPDGEQSKRALRLAESAHLTDYELRVEIAH